MCGQIKDILQRIAKKEDLVLQDRQPFTALGMMTVDGQNGKDGTDGLLTYWLCSFDCVALATSLAEDSGRNLRKAILMLEACSVKQSAPLPTPLHVTTTHRHTASHPLAYCVNCHVSVAQP